MGRKQNPLSARVKRMMQADVEVGKIAGPTPALISANLALACACFTLLVVQLWKVGRYKHCAAVVPRA